MRRGKPSGWQITSVTKQIWSPPTSTEWDALLLRYALTEQNAAKHPEVRLWVGQNCRRRYVPQSVLDALGIEVTYEWGDV